MTIVFSPRELVNIAVQIEKNGFLYYSRLAEKISKEETRKIFSELAQAEQDHIRDFRKIEESLSGKDLEIPEAYKSEDADQYLKTLSDCLIFGKAESADSLVMEIHNDRDAVLHAITFEKDSILFFHEIQAMLAETNIDNGVVLELIRQEKAHLAKLVRILPEAQG